MKITINRMALQKALEFVLKAVSSKPLIPIMNNILVALDDEGTLRITASDGELICLRSVLKPDLFEEPGVTTIPGKLLYDFIKTLQEDIITITQTDHNTVIISWDKGTSELPTMEPDDFICITPPDQATAKRLECSAQDLTSAIAATIGCVAQDGTRPALTGLYFDIAPAESNIVSSDSHELHYYRLKTPAVTEAASFIMHARAAGVLRTALPKEMPVMLLFDSKCVHVICGQNEMVTRLIDAKYPNYKSIIPTDNDCIVTIGRATLSNALQHMIVVSDKRLPTARFKLGFNSIELNAEDLGRGTRANETLECDYDGTEMELAIKAHSLLDAVGILDCENVELAIKDPRKAILINPDEKGREDQPVTILIMPQVISN